MRFLNFIFKTIYLLLCLALLAGLLGFIHPALDTFSHFRLHLSLTLFGAVFYALLIKAPKYALFGFIFSVFCLYTTHDGTKLSAQTHEPIAGQPTYTMLHFNLLWNNPYKQEVREHIALIDPDIIALTEITRNWVKVLDGLGEKWPYKYICNISERSGGTQFISKWPIVENSEVCLEYASYAKVTLMPPDGKPIDVLSPHFRWPWPASGPRQLRKIKPQLKTLLDDVIVAGDFNAVTWSWMMKDFAQTGGLQIYPGIGSTWIAYGEKFPFLFPFGLPIDNVMQKGRVHILSGQTLPSWGSDHLPILIKFQLNK